MYDLDPPIATSGSNTGGASASSSSPTSAASASAAAPNRCMIVTLDTKTMLDGSEIRQAFSTAADDRLKLVSWRVLFGLVDERCVRVMLHFSNV